MTEIRFTSDITVRLVQKAGGDEMAVAAAKVSVSGEEALKYADPAQAEGNAGLINYLMKMRHGCYDDQTDVLTGDGWKPWPLVDGSESFATLNLATDEIQYQSATRVVHREWSGPMVRLRMAQVDALVTPDHNMVSASRTRHGWAVGLYPAKDFLGRCHRLRLGGGLWSGPLHAPDEAALAGFAAADGHVGGSIEFHLRRPRKVEWLRSRADVSASDGHYRLTRVSERLRRWCEATYTGAGDRCLPREILACGDAETVRALLDGYLEGDGSVSPTGKVNCSTVSRRMVGDLQEAALKVGAAAVETAADDVRSGSFGSRPLYRLTMYRGRNSDPRIGWTTEARREQVSLVDYCGSVHCVTVPNGTLYVRRNGKPLWCGNTPFEHSCLTFFVHAPIFVFREWHRHRIGHSYNEESARYKQLDPVFWLPRRGRKMVPAPDHKPARPKFVPLESDHDFADAVATMKALYALAYGAYEANMARGVAKEVARAVLPVGIYSSCWVTVNPRSLMAFLSLRTHEPSARHVSYPQAEIEEAARACEDAFRQGWPVTWKAWNDYGRVAP